MSSQVAIRIKAAELAAQVVASQGFGDAGIGARLWSMAVFFETYITRGASETNDIMNLLNEDTDTPGFRVIAGGSLKDRA